MPGDRHPGFDADRRSTRLVYGNESRSGTSRGPDEHGVEVCWDDDGNLMWVSVPGWPEPERATHG